MLKLGGGPKQWVAILFLLSLLVLFFSYSGNLSASSFTAISKNGSSSHPNKETHSEKTDPKKESSVGTVIKEVVSSKSDGYHSLSSRSGLS